MSEILLWTICGPKKYIKSLIAVSDCCQGVSTTNRFGLDDFSNNGTCSYYAMVTNHGFVKNYRVCTNPDIIHDSDADATTRLLVHGDSTKFGSVISSNNANVWAYHHIVTDIDRS